MSSQWRDDYVAILKSLQNVKFLLDTLVVDPPKRFHLKSLANLLHTQVWGLKEPKEEETKLSWREVFSTHRSFLSLNDASAAAYNAKYKYVEWKGLVYPVLGRGPGYMGSMGNIKDIMKDS